MRKRKKVLLLQIEVYEKEIEELNGLLEEKNEDIRELKENNIRLSKFIEDQKEVINVLKTSRSLEIKRDQANKKKWLAGFYGEEYEDDSK